MTNEIQFIHGSLQEFKAATKNDATLYFLTDAKKIFKGNVDMTEAAVIVSAFPEIADAVEGKLYINEATSEIRMLNGGEWAIVVPAIVKTKEGWAGNDNNNSLATIAVIKAAIEAVKSDIEGGENLVTDVTWNNETGSGDGKLQINKGDGTVSEVVLNGVPYSITYDKDALKITVEAYGQAPVEISLPKDNFVRSGSYDAEEKEIVLIVDDDTAEEGTKEIRIPAESLIDVYTGETSDGTSVTVSESKAIKVDIVIDPAAGNALSKSPEGLLVDVSGKADKLDESADNAGIVLVATANGNYALSGVKIVSKGTDAAEDKQVPTVAYMNDEVGKKISIKGNGGADEIITSTQTGDIKRSGKTVGGAELSEDPSANVVATEAAVANAVKAALTWGSF